MKEELFPIVTPDGEVTGCASRTECHSGSMLLHPVVHLHLITPDGLLFLQKRVLTKDIQPGKWDTAVGGHVDYGEDVLCALRREAKEELGYDILSPEFVMRYVFQSDREKELVNVFAEVVSPDVNLNLSPEEIETGRFWTPEEIKDASGHGLLTPNFEQEYLRIAPILEKIARKKE